MSDWPKVNEIDFSAIERQCGRNAAKVARGMIEGEWAGAGTALIAEAAGLKFSQAYRAIRRLCDASLMHKTSGVISRTNWQIAEDALPQIPRIAAMTIEKSYLVIVTFPRFGRTVTGRYITNSANEDEAVAKVKSAVSKSFKLKRSCIDLQGIYLPDANDNADAITIY